MSEAVEDEGGKRKGRKAGQGAKPDRAPVVKTADEVKDIIFMVARMASGVDALLKQEGPELSITQVAILEALSKEGEARPVQLARRIATSRQVIQAAVRGLSNAGYVTSSRSGGPAKGGAKGAAKGDDQPKQQVIIRITDDGTSVLATKAAIYGKLAEALNEKRPGLKMSTATRVLKVFSAVLEHSNSGKKKQDEGDKGDDGDDD